MEYDKKAKDRLKRLEGQMRGILKMMEAGQDCRDVVTQLAASRSAINSLMGLKSSIVLLLPLMLYFHSMVRMISSNEMSMKKF